MLILWFLLKPEYRQSLYACDNIRVVKLSVGINIYIYIYQKWHNNEIIEQQLQKRTEASTGAIAI